MRPQLQPPPQMMRAAKPTVWAKMSDEHRSAIVAGGLDPETFGVLEATAGGQFGLGYGDTPAGPMLMLNVQAPVDLRDFVKPLSKLGLGARPEDAVGRYVIEDLGMVPASVRIQVVLRRASVSPAVLEQTYGEPEADTQATRNDRRALQEALRSLAFSGSDERHAEARRVLAASEALDSPAPAAPPVFESLFAARDKHL